MISVFSLLAAIEKAVCPPKFPVLRMEISASASINKRAMSVGIEQLRSAPIRVLTSGGAEKLDALIGGLELVKPTVFVTDEQTASALLARAGRDSGSIS